MSTLTKNKKPNAFVRLTKHSEFTIGLVVIALFLLATFLTKNFFGSYNLKNLTKQGATPSRSLSRTVQRSSSSLTPSATMTSSASCRSWPASGSSWQSLPS